MEDTVKARGGEEERVGQSRLLRHFAMLSLGVH